MGSQGGGGYSTSPASFQVLKNNIGGLARKYPLDAENRFGTKISERIWRGPHRYPHAHWAGVLGMP